jgi:hypothetical protein
MQHATCNLPGRRQQTCTVQHATFGMQHATFGMQHATCGIQHATFGMQHATCGIQHAVNGQEATDSTARRSALHRAAEQQDAYTCAASQELRRHCRPLHIARCMLRVACCKRRGACSMMHTVWCLLHVAWCLSTLHAVYGTAKGTVQGAAHQPAAFCPVLIACCVLLSVLDIASLGVEQDVRVRHDERPPRDLVVQYRHLPSSGRSCASMAESRSVDLSVRSQRSVHLGTCQPLFPSIRRSFYL